ncbi:hypothetical protein IMZ48_29335 [Candidatus Bathyarchaeota archaeon]|nr:hypothetical protein [Candidatus Bathyarchaeota archaeon]
MWPPALTRARLGKPFGVGVCEVAEARWSLPTPETDARSNFQPPTRVKLYPEPAPSMDELAGVSPAMTDHRAQAQHRRGLRGWSTSCRCRRLSPSGSSEPKPALSLTSGCSLTTKYEHEASRVQPVPR